MKRFISGLAAFMVTASAALLALSSGGVRPVFACTGSPVSWTFAEADTVFEGRVIAVVERPEREDKTFRWFDVSILVTVSHRGTTAGEELMLHSRLPKPGIPVMCQLSPHTTFEGRYVVAATSAKASDEFRSWSFVYLESEPVGAAYEVAARLARAAVGTDPALPVLALSRVNDACTTTVLVRGSGFHPGASYTLAYPGAWGDGTGEPPRVTADASGRLAHSFQRGPETCELEGWLEALPIVDGQVSWGLPVAMHRLSDDLPVAPLPPDVGNSAPIQDTREHSPARVVAAALGLVLASGAIGIGRRLRASHLEPQS